jgi:hypothetical protein
MGSSRNSLAACIVGIIIILCCPSTRGGSSDAGEQGAALLFSLHLQLLLLCVSYSLCHCWLET